MTSPEHPALYDAVQAPAYYRYVIQPLMILLSPILVPVRIVLAIILVGLSACIDWLTNLGTDPEQPLSAWRLRVYRLNKLVLYRLTLLACGYLVVVRGRRDDSVGALVCNHQSQIDILVGGSVGISAVIAKAGVARNPLFRPTLRVTRSILARAGGGYEAVQKRLATKGLYPPLGVFPGGTTTNQRLLPRFRSSVFASGPRVQVMTMRYHTYGRVFYIVGSEPLNLWRMLAGALTVIEVRFHSEIYDKREGESAQDYADRVGNAMAALLPNGVYTGYDYRDVLWFCGDSRFEGQLSERYRQEQLWRGQWPEWMQRCQAAGLDPYCNHSRTAFEAVTAKGEKAE